MVWSNLQQLKRLKQPKREAQNKKTKKKTYKWNEYRTDCLFCMTARWKHPQILQHVEWYDNEIGSNRTPKVIFLWHILKLAVFQGRISECMTKAFRTRQAGWDSFSYSSADLMARTHTHMNTERRAEAKLYLQRCGRLERQAHYAVRDILYHWLTFIMLNLPQTPQPVLHMQSSPPCHSHICRQRLMGVEHCVTVLPCI